MHEFEPPESVEYDTYTDVLDALEFAFINEELQECSVDELPVRGTDNDIWTDAKKRFKISYDETRGCTIKVSHFEFYVLREKNENHEAGVMRGERVYVEWADGNFSNLQFDLELLSFGSYRYIDGVYDRYVYADDEDAFANRKQLKISLAAVTSLD
ncbi:MAG: hypothetical protein V4611_03810 [Patescibacteria group bacterium]